MLIIGAIASLMLLGVWIAYLMVSRRMRDIAKIAELDAYAHGIRWYGEWIGSFCCVLAVAAGFLAAAGPERKTKVPFNIYEGACHGIALDASFSMKAPVEKRSKETRLGRAVKSIEELVNEFPEGDRLAFMAFAATPHIFPLMWTSDRERIFFPQLRGINESYVAIYGREGSNIPAAIGAWLKALPVQILCQPFIFIFTDGEPEGEKDKLDQSLMDSLTVFSQLKSAISIFIVAVGDHREPLRIPEYDVNGGFAGSAVNAEGKFVFSRPDLGYLEEVASRFRARVVFADKGEDLKQKVASAVEQVRKVAAVDYKESFVPVAWVCTLLFLFFLMAAIVMLTL